MLPGFKSWWAGAPIAGVAALVCRLLARANWCLVAWLTSKRSTRPNLFHYATKELSQDAVICWLIDWAGQGKCLDPGHEELRRCGLRFVNAMLNHKRDVRTAVKLGTVIETRVCRQELGIDVLARIDNKRVLLIEDKTDTKEHGEQLSNYYKAVVEGRTQFGEVLERDVYAIYLKTGNQSLHDDRGIEDKNYKVFNRRDVLSILNDYKGRDAILMNFRQYLQGWEDETNRYMEWAKDAHHQSQLAWEGLYRQLETDLDNGTRRPMGWRYVNNRSGGFLGFWWWPSKNDELYLQIERDPRSKRAKLCFKVNAEEKDEEEQERLKCHWHNRVMGAGGNRVVRPRVMRKGQHMTVALWKDDWMAFGERDKLDVPRTIDHLEQAESVLQAAIRSGPSR